MKRELLDSSGGVLTYFSYDPHKDRTIIETEQDVSSILRSNKASYNQHHGAWGDGDRVARIPQVVLDRYRQKTGIDLMKPENEAHLRRFLNDPDNRFMRTRPGRV